MSEGGIYLCNWSKRKAGYTLALRANTDIEASDPDLETCMEAMCMRIAEWNGDGEAILELFPPQRGKKVPGAGVLFRTIGYNDSVRAIDYASLFEGGACAVCKFGLGPRNDRALEIEGKLNGVACAVHGCYPILLVFQQQFVDALTDGERACFDIRPVTSGGKTAAYVELVAKETVRTTGYRGAEYPTAFSQSWRCGECGREKFSVDMPKLTGSQDCIDSRDIDGTSASMIVIDDGWRHFPAFRLPRWEALLEGGMLKGLLSNPLFVLDPEYVEHPVLEETRGFDWVM